MVPAGTRRIRFSRILEVAFWGLLAAWLGYFVIYPCFIPYLQVDLRSCGPIQHERGPWYSTVIRRFLPDNALVLEEGRGLRRCVPGSPDSVDGRGCFYWASRLKLVWSSPDLSDSRNNGRQYTIIARIAPPGQRTGAVVGAVLLAFLVGFTFRGRSLRQVVAARCQILSSPTQPGLSLIGPSPVWLRAGFLAVTTVLLMCAMWQDWNRVDLSQDSSSYVSFHAIRTPLYPSLISLLDRKDGRELPELNGTITCHQEDNRFLNVIHAQKIIWIVALMVLLWVLSGSINCWFLGLLTYLAALADRDPCCSQLVNLHCLMTEGINYSLVFLYLAAVWAYLRRPARWRLLGLALILVVMLLHRPANAPFLAIVPVLGLFHWFRSERKQAWLVPAVVVAIIGGYCLTHFSINYHRVGYFRPHAFTGSQCISTTLQVANLDDVGTIGDAQLDDFLRTCLVDYGSRRVLDYRSDPHGEYVNINIYQVAMPAYHRVFGKGNAWHEDEVYTRVARHLFCRHPWACLKLAVYHFGVFWDPLLHTLCAACLGIAFVTYWKTRRFEWLFLAYVGVCPFLLAIPACAIEFPLPRYRSQMYFAEVLMLPLAITLGIGHLRRRSVAANRRNEEPVGSRLRAA